MNRTVYTHTLAPMTRQEEKAELQYINELFSKYLAKVRATRQEATQVNSVTLLGAVKTLEDEIGVIKGLYEKELDRIRGELQQLSVEKQRFEALAVKNVALVQELQDKLTGQAGKGTGLVYELDNLRKLVAKKDVEISQLQAENKRVAHALGDLTREYEILLRNYKNLSGEYEQAKLTRAESQDMVASLQKKLEFNAQVSAKEVAELKHLLEVKGQQILQLEVKVRDMGKGDNSFHAMLLRVRSAADGDLKKYKAESEAQYTKNLFELRTQMDQDAANIGKLSDENKKLSGAIDDYIREVTALKGTVRILEQNNAGLISNLAQERQKSSVHMQGLEVKLREMQETLIFKLKELGSGREPSIRAEIEALKALLELEEKELQVSSVGGKSTSVHITATTHGTTQSTQQRALAYKNGNYTTSVTTTLQKGQSATNGLSTNVKSEAPASQVKTSTYMTTGGGGKSQDYYASKRESVILPRLNSRSDAGLCTAITSYNGSKEDYNQQKTGRLRVIRTSRYASLS